MFTHMPKICSFLKHKKKFIYLLSVIFLSLAFFLMLGCSNKSILSQQELSISSPQIALVSDNINLTFFTKEPGIKNIVVRISNEFFNQTYILKNYPYTLLWKPDQPGIYRITATGYSILDGKSYTTESTITIYDTAIPKIEEIRTIPENPYLGDEMLVQIKLGSKNPKVSLNLSGSITNQTSNILSWIKHSLTTKPGYIYVRLPNIDKSGNMELFVKSETIYTQDATKVTIPIREIDRTPPEIEIDAKTFYSVNANVIFTFTLTDNNNLKFYKVLYDGNIIDSGNISGKLFSKSINLGKQELGAHSLNIEVYDSEGNLSIFPKIIYVGGVALSFNVEVRPPQPTAGASAVIAMVPDEEGVEYSKIVFFVDGKTIATNLAPSSGKSASGFTIWTVEEGKHFVTIYAESNDGRAGIGETTVYVRDYNGPKFISLKANGITLSKTDFNQVFPGLVTFKLTVYDPGGVSLTTKPRLLIKEDEFEGFYRDLQMEPEEVSSDGKTVVFSVTTTMSIGYYYVTVINVQDKSGNLMPDIGKFLLYVQ